MAYAVLRLSGGAAARPEAGFAAQSISVQAADGENANTVADAALWQQAQDEGRMVKHLPTHRMVLDNVMHDRRVAGVADLEKPKASIRTRGAFEANKTIVHLMDNLRRRPDPMVYVHNG